MACHMQLSNPASAVSLGVTDHTRYVVPWLPSWPSITIEPNATVCTNQSPHHFRAFPSDIALIGGANRCMGAGYTYHKACNALF